MQYRIYDSQHGLMLQMFDTYLVYLALFTFSIIFSFLTYIVIEGPTSTLLRIFFGVAKKETAPVPEIKASLVPTDDQDQPKKRVKKVKKKKKAVSINPDESME